MQIRIAALVVALAAESACGAGGPAADKPEEPAQVKLACERMADHLVGLMAPGRKELAPEASPSELADKIARVIVERCATDQWGRDARTCFGAVATLEAASDCAPYLTVPQRDGMDRAMEAALGPPPAGAPQ